jgi:hypothetical protein
MLLEKKTLLNHFSGFRNVCLPEDDFLLSLPVSLRKMEDVILSASSEINCKILGREWFFW